MERRSKICIDRKSPAFVGASIEGTVSVASSACTRHVEQRINTPILLKALLDGNCGRFRLGQIDIRQSSTMNSVAALGGELCGCSCDAGGACNQDNHGQYRIRIH